MSGAIHEREHEAAFMKLREIHIAADDIARQPEKKTVRQPGFQRGHIRQQRMLNQRRVADAFHDFMVRGLDVTERLMQFPRPLLDFLLQGAAIFFKLLVRRLQSAAHFDET